MATGGGQSCFEPNRDATSAVRASPHTDHQWSLPKADEHKLASHQSWHLYRMVPAAPHTVCFGSLPLLVVLHRHALLTYRWFHYVPAKLDYTDLFDILSLFVTPSDPQSAHEISRYMSVLIDQLSRQPLPPRIGIRQDGRGARA